MAGQRLRRPLSEEQSPPGNKADTSNTDPDTATPTMDYEAILAKQAELVKKLKSKKQPQEAVAEPNNEEEDMERRYAQAKREYQKKKERNQLGIQDEIAFMRIEAEYDSFKRKQQEDADFENVQSDAGDSERVEGGMFMTSDAEVPDLDEIGTSPQRERKRAAAAGSDDQPASKKRKRTDAEGSAAKRTRKSKSKSKTTNVAGQDYSHEDMGHVLEASKTTKAKAKKTSKKRSEPAHQVTNVASVMGSNLFADTRATAHLPSQPTFTGHRRRDKALTALLASVDEDSATIARDDKRFLLKALRSFTGQGSVSPADDGNWALKGLRGTLKHFQVIGAAFIRGRERSGSAPTGGILADEMGLAMLANIVNGKPAPNAKTPRTTLVVAPPALLIQWGEEIRRHCYSIRDDKHGLGKVMKYRSADPIVGMESIQDIFAGHDVVLTTYQEVLKSFPKWEDRADLITAEQKQEVWKQQWQAERGPLHRFKFLRVVLDEAAVIKNHTSRTSKACIALQADYYWAISGTPVQNSINFMGKTIPLSETYADPLTLPLLGLKEFYPYFKFLHQPYAASYRMFCHNFCTQADPTGTERLNALLRTLMIRRTHIDRLFNSKLLDLPPPKEDTIRLEFNSVEREVYNIVRKRFVQRINHMAKDGAMNRKFSSIWALVTRLRQITASVLLVFDSCLGLLEREDFEKLNRITMHEQEFNDDGRALLVHLRNVLHGINGSPQMHEGGMAGRMVTENEAFATGIVGNEDAEDALAGGRHGQSYHFQKYLTEAKKTSEWREAKLRAECCGCRHPPNNPHITSCDHIYCLDCLEDLSHHAAVRGRDHAKCVECGEEFTQTWPCEETFESTDARPTADTGSPDIEELAARGKKKTEGIDWLGLKGEVLPSAKSLACKAAVLSYIQEDEEARMAAKKEKEAWMPVKIIVFTQWLPMIEILAKMCKTESWGYCCYSGKMSQENRAAAIRDFSSKPERQLLLASLRCGGLGLNITAASRVIIVDNWWNLAAEQQGFARVFRIGQSKETRLLRLVVKNTVDEALMAMKEKKRIEIDDVMNSAKLKEKLNVEDLMRLFGPIDEDGFIIADELTEEDMTRIPMMDDP